MPRRQQHTVFLGDCQALALAQIYRDFIAPVSQEKVSHVNDALAGTAVAAEQIADADVIVLQVFDVDSKLSDAASSARARKVRFPALFGGFLWPFAGQAAHPRNQPTPYLTSGPYPAQLGDVFLNKLIARGVSAEEAPSQYKGLDIARGARLDRLAELHLAAQAARDKETDLSFAALIESKFRESALFLTTHHPTLYLMIPLIWSVFDQLGVPYPQIELIVNALRTAPFPNHALPLHPGVISHFKLSFADQATRYPFNWEGSFTFDEYVARYVSFIWNEDLYKGIWLAPQKDPDLAYVTLQRGLASSPQSSGGWRALSQLLLRMRRVVEAREAAEHAVSLDPADPANHAALARVLMREQKLSEALAAARKAVEVFPHDGRSHQIVAEICAQMRRNDEAMTSAKRALALRPGDHGLYGLLGHVLYRKERLIEAETAFRKAVRDPALGGFRFSFAQVLYSRAQYDEALTIAHELAASGDPHAHALVGHIHARQHDFEGAAAAFRKAIEMAPQFTPFRQALASVISRQAAASPDPDNAPPIAKT